MRDDGSDRTQMTDDSEHQTQPALAVDDTEGEVDTMGEVVFVVPMEFQDEGTFGCGASGRFQMLGAMELDLPAEGTPNVEDYLPICFPPPPGLGLPAEYGDVHISQRLMARAWSPTANTMSEIFPVSASSGFIRHPKTEIGPTGNVVVAWREGEGGGDRMSFNTGFGWGISPSYLEHTIQVPEKVVLDDFAPQLWRHDLCLGPGGSVLLPFVAESYAVNAGEQHDEELVLAGFEVEERPTPTREFAVNFGGDWRLSAEPPSDATWREREFDDSTWTAGIAPLGFGADGVGTPLPEMQGDAPTLYARTKFELDDPALLDSLTLLVDYDDALVVYINGVESVRANISEETPSFYDTADGPHDAGEPEWFVLDDALETLRGGENVLAVEIHNVALHDEDLYFDVRVITFADCNENGTSDRIDILTGSSPDGNANGIPDECEGTLFRRGDANGDGIVDISDAMRILNFLFLGGDEPPCLDAADACDEGRLTLSGAVRILTWLFVGGASLPTPGPWSCGLDLSEDDLDCLSYEQCP